MRAALLTRFGAPLEVVDDVKLDEPRSREVLVRVTHCGVCHTDYTVWKSGDPRYQLPAMLGHEAAGVVAKLGADIDDLAVDQPVVLSMRAPCGTCFQCTRGAPVLCERQASQAQPRAWWRGAPVSRVFGMGAFAEFALLSRPAVVPLRADMAREVAAVIGCAVQTGIGAVTNIARMAPAASALVIGSGTVGLCVIQGSVLAGASTIIALDPSQSRREQALLLGATHAFDPAAPNLLQRIRALTSGRGVDHAFDLVCGKGTAELAVAACRPGGQTILIGVSAADHLAQIATTPLVMQQKSITGCILGNCHPQRDFETFMALWQAGRLAIDKLVTAVRPLEDINVALADLEATRGLRTVLAI